MVMISVVIERRLPAEQLMNWKAAVARYCPLRKAKQCRSGLLNLAEEYLKSKSGSTGNDSMCISVYTRTVLHRSMSGYIRSSVILVSYQDDVT